MKLFVAGILLSIGVIVVGYTDRGDYRMEFVRLTGWGTLFAATVAAGFLQLRRPRS